MASKVGPYALAAGLGVSVALVEAVLMRLSFAGGADAENLAGWAMVAILVTMALGVIWTTVMALKRDRATPAILSGILLVIVWFVSFPLLLAWP